jgi:Pyruvate/2-oxoacid:ferredoxin oxidoreductase delta subunit
MISSLRLYFFSGTGNARHVARWIADAAGERGVPTEVVDIAGIDRKHPGPPPEGAMVGFISPTHGFNFPPVTMYFLFRFPRSRGNTAFVVNTRAGMKLSKWFLPGISGITLWLAAFVLLLKGYRICALRSIDLPSNWISFHPGLKEKVVESIYERCRRISYSFTAKILSGKRVYRVFYDIIQDALVAPISIGYFFVGRFILAKSFYATEACDRCDICIRQCPVKAIRVVDGRPFWSWRCESCMHCMNTCPKRAIETAHGYIAGAMVLFNMVVVIWFWRWVGRFIAIPAGHEWGKLLVTFTGWGLSFLTMVISYRVFHYLLRIPVLREIFYYTSFTRYRFWRRYRIRRQ